MNKKEIIKLIKKIAQPKYETWESEDIQTGQSKINANTGSLKTAETNKSQQVYISNETVNAVRNMQQALIDVGNQVLGQKGFAGQQNIKKQDDKQKTFNSFIAKGLSTNDSPAEDLNALDILRDVGSNNKTDGKWGRKTVNALGNLYGFAYKLVIIANKLNIANDLFTDKQLQDYMSLANIQEYDAGGLVKIPDKEERAKKLTDYIKRIGQLYAFLQNQIMQGDNEKLLTGETSLGRYDVSEKDQYELTPDEKAVSQLQSIQIILNGAPQIFRQIPISAFTSKEKMFELIKQKMPQVKDNEYISIYNESILPFINNITVSGSA